MARKSMKRPGGGGPKQVRKGPIRTPFKDAICSKPGKR